MFGYFMDGHVNVKGSFLPKRQRGLIHLGQNLRLLRQNGSGPEHTQIYPEESCKTSLPERNKNPGVCGVFVLNTRSTFEHLMVIHVYFV